MNAKFVFGIILLTLGGLLSAANWWSLYLSYATKRNHSAVPFFGAALLLIGFLSVPTMRPFWWVTPFLDHGTLAFIIALPHLINEAWNTSRFNLLSEYVGKSGNKTVHLRLFRRGVFTIRIGIELQPGQCGCTSCGKIGKWQRDSNRLLLEDYQNQSAIMRPDASRKTLLQVVGFPSLENDPSLSLADVQFVLAKGRAVEEKEKVSVNDNVR